MTREWFPAWVLLEEPGLAAALAPRRTDDDPSRAFDATMSLLAHPSLDGHAIELRRSLQASHPGLLERFLAERARATAPVPLPGKKTGPTAASAPPIAATNHAGTRTTVPGFCSPTLTRMPATVALQLAAP